MRTTTQKLQTNLIPGQLTPMEINEAARSLALYFKDGEFNCQNFFTPPQIGEINWIEGLEADADVFFREITLVGTNLLHLRLVGAEEAVNKMCKDPKLFKVLRGIDATFDDDVWSRWYFETTADKGIWDVLVSLDKKTFFVANLVHVKDEKIRLENVIVVGDRLLGLTADGKLVQAHITPELLEKEGVFLEAEFMDVVNKLGKIDLITPAPNSKEFFFVGVKEGMYQFNIWGDMIFFTSLGEATKINSIDFNHRKAVVATDDGIFEFGVREMADIVRTTSLPRRIIHPVLKDSFRFAHYVDDPYVLGVRPAMGIFAKTMNDKVICF